MILNKRLFIGSLPYRFTEGQLLDLFVPYGRIVAIRIMHNRWGKSRGLGFVEFDNLASAVKAKEELHNYQIEDLKIIVDFAKEDPALTPEGQERHQQALLRRPLKPAKNTPKNSSKFFNRDQSHLRQSVFNSRFHGAKVGRKFSQRTKKNIK
jgi:RNA recognition motif-containing protein